MRFERCDGLVWYRPPQKKVRNDMVRQVASDLQCRLQDGLIKDLRFGLDRKFAAESHFGSGRASQRWRKGVVSRRGRGRRPGHAAGN